MILPRPIYSGLLYAAVPAAMLYLYKRSRKQPQYLEHWSERFGTAHYPPRTKGRTRIWIHAVSVGETRATFSLVESILKRWPNTEILYTHMTPTGREVGAKFAQKFGNRIAQCYLPYDTPRAVKKFLKATQPDLCLLMETEVWPNLTYFTKKLGIPTVLVNGRLSEKSFKQGQKAGSLIKDAFGRLTMALAQYEEDAERLKAAGAHDVKVLGNLKFDFTPNAIQLRTGREILKYAERDIIGLASSREGEEQKFLEALKKAQAAGVLEDRLILIVPRHPQRFEEVAKLIEKSGFTYIKRSQIRDWKTVLSKQGPQIVFGDSMGEMGFYYALSSLVIMGGSFENYGCQSVIEPCAIGLPVIVGPSIFNFDFIVKKAESEGALLRAADFTEALRIADDVLSDPAKRAEIGEKAAKFAQEQRGATERTIQVIDMLLKGDTNANQAS